MLDIMDLSTAIVEEEVAGSLLNCFGDYANNGTRQVATWRPSNGNWYVYGVGTTTFGINGDIPVPGDNAEVGSTQMATWRSSNNNWYVDGVGIITNRGTTGDAPLPLPYAIRHCSLE